MAQTLFRVLLLLSVSGAFGKYVYVEKKVTWHEAQEYCRLNYTDLAPISNLRDFELIDQLFSTWTYYMWIGLYKDEMTWKWSGGGNVSSFFWGPHYSHSGQGNGYGAIYRHWWINRFGRFIRIPFLCYRVIVVRERKTWEEALRHCREHHRDLASLVSETEMLLVQKEMDKAPTTKHVWTGMRFLGGCWLWVDGEPVEYKAWRQDAGLQCPAANLHCGAMREMGGLNGTGTLFSNGTRNNGMTSGAAGVETGAWEARDCVEKLHFLCY